MLLCAEGERSIRTTWDERTLNTGINYFDLYLAYMKMIIYGRGNSKGVQCCYCYTSKQPKTKGPDQALTMPIGVFSADESPVAS